MTTPAGWYPDSSGQQRYWDGNAWTEHVQPPAGQPGAEQPPVGEPVAPQQPAAGGYASPPTGGGYGGQRWAPTAYLEGAGSDFQGAIRDGIANITQWEGRASRSSFWWFVLFAWLVSIVVNLVLIPIKVPVLSYLVSVLFFLAFLALGIRRLHDTNRSGWWILLDLVPCFGWIVLIIFFVMEGTQGPNQHNIDSTGGRQAA